MIESWQLPAGEPAAQLGELLNRLNDLVLRANEACIFPMLPATLGTEDLVAAILDVEVDA